MTDTHEQLHFVRFRGSGAERLIDLDNVVEVIPMVRLIESEHEGNARYCGLLHYRGRVVPVFDLEDGSQAELDNPQNFLLITRGHEREQAVIAREVYGVVQVDAGSCSELVTGSDHRVRVVDVAGSLISVLEPERLAQ